MICAILLAASAAQPLLVFRGNVALVEDVYRAVLELPPGTKATIQNARSVAGKLRRFLHRAGYALANVLAHVEGEQIIVDVDEGRLDKVIFLGGGAFETLRLRLDLHLPEDVYNKPDLERQLRALSKRLGLSEFAYEVVPVENVPAQKVLLEDLEPLEELSLGLVRPGRPYELRILVQPGVFRPGVSPELEIDSLQGAGIGAVYHSGRLLLREDRFSLGGRIAGALRQKLDNQGSAFAFTRALGEASYEAPPIAGVVRPSIRGRVDLTDRQRPDLHLQSFEFATLEAAAEVLFLPIPHLRASIGGGMQRRLLFSVEPAFGASPAVAATSFAQNRPYAEASLQLTFDPANIRRDRHHRLLVEARFYGPPHPGQERARHLFAGYQKMVPLGWNELWIEARASSKTGFVLFPEEDSIGGDPLRGAFGGEYARRLAALELEFRYALLRDSLKLGLFHNAAVYGRLPSDRISTAEKPALANAFGLGVHALLIDEFQLDAWFGVGFASGGMFDRGAALAIRQAF
jgi:hypothetical protein